MKKKSFIVIVILLIAIILGLCVFIAYDKNLFGIKGEKKESSNTVEKKEDTNKTKEVDINSELVNTLTDIVRKYKITGNTQDVLPYSETNEEVVIKDALNDEIKGAVVFNSVSYNEFISKYVLNDEESLITAQKIYGNTYADTTTKVLNDAGIQYLKDTFKNMFGYDGFSGALGCPNIKNENGVYFMHGGCGVGPYLNISELHPISAQMENDDIIINAKVVFARWDGVPGMESSTFSDLILSTNKYNEEDSTNLNKLDEETYKNIQNLSTNDTANFNKLLKDYAKNNSDKLETYAYKFKKYNNNYYLYSIKKV